MNIKNSIQKRPIILPLAVLIIVILACDSFLPTIFIRNHYIKHINSKCFQYLILDEGKTTKKGNHISYTAKVIRYFDKTENKWEKCTGNIKIYVPRFYDNETENERFAYGDIIYSCDELSEINNFSEDFNYVRYMKHQRIYHSVFLKNWQKIDKNKGNPIISLAKKINQKLHQRLYDTNLKKDSKSLAVAMLLGDNKEIEPNLRQYFNTSGLAHILCFSGLHIGIITLFFSYLLKYLVPPTIKGYSIRVYLSIIIVWLLDFIVGLTPSATRVALMFTILSLSKLYMLYYDRINVLLVVVFLSLIVKPYLLFNISFQLSYSAVLGIFIFVEIWKKYSSEKRSRIRKTPYKLLYNAGITTSAQVFTLPIILYYFKYFPFFFLISNIIVIPLLQIILVSILVLMVFCNVPLLGDCICFVCDLELQFLIFIAKLFS